jgi:hypothetical protein
VEHLRPQIAADRIVHAVAEHGGGDQRGIEQPQVHAARSAQRAGDEEQRVARQEGRDDEAGLGEDDQEQDGIHPGAVLGEQGREVLVEVDGDVPGEGEQFHEGAMIQEPS